MIGYLAKEASDNHLGGETSTRISFGPKIGLGLARGIHMLIQSRSGDDYFHDLACLHYRM